MRGSKYTQSLTNISGELKNAWSYTGTPTYALLAWCLIKHRDNFTLA